MGSLGSGYAAKLINNLIVGGEITLIAEALGLARKAGLDMARLLEALSGGAASSPVLSLKGGRMISGDYTPSSRVLIHLKDQRNAQGWRAPWAPTSPPATCPPRCSGSWRTWGAAART